MFCHCDTQNFFVHSLPKDEMSPYLHLALVFLTDPLPIDPPRQPARASLSPGEEPFIGPAGELMLITWL